MRLVLLVAIITYCFWVWADDDRESYRSPAQIICCYDGDCHDCKSDFYVHNDDTERRLPGYEIGSLCCDCEQIDDLKQCIKRHCDDREIVDSGCPDPGTNFIWVSSNKKELAQ